MSGRTRMLLLVLIMVSVALSVGGITIYILYTTHLEQQRERLTVTARSQARLIEAVARFDRIYNENYPQGSTQATLSQVIDARKQFQGFGRSGEFTLARRQGGMIVYLLRHRYDALEQPKPVPFGSERAQPMRLALAGKSGSMVALDYRGETVLAAYEPVALLNFGIVVKLDLAEIRAPFVRAGLVATALAITIILGGTAMFLRVSNPIIERLEDSEANLLQLNEELEQRVQLRTAQADTINRQLSQEIHVRKQVAEALQRSEQQVRLLLDSTAEAIYGLDLEGVCTFANAASVRLLGYQSSDDLVGKKMHNLIHHTRSDNSPYPEVECPIYSSFRTGRRNHVDDEVLWRFDGSSFWAEYWSYPILSEDRIVGSVVTFLDITERKRTGQELLNAHEKLLRQEKLAVLGQLAGSVGHELRNPLGVIANAVYYLKMILPEADATVEEYLETISTEVHHSAMIVGDLLDLSRTRPAEREDVDVAQLITRELCASQPGEQVEVVVDVPADLPSLHVDRHQIQQTLHNLTINALQAMPAGGTLTIRVRHVEDELHLSVEDTGCGISEQDMENLFEPLFTTKARGIGLGLSVSRSLIEVNGGSIEVASELDRGSTFTLALPVKQSLS